MNYIRENLAVCGFRGIRSREEFQRHGFHAQLQCAGGFDRWLHDCIDVMSMPFEDGAPIPEQLFHQAQDWLGIRWDAGSKILVSCAAGHSRSVTMAMALLKTKGHMRFLDAAFDVIDRVPEAYPSPHVLASAAVFCGEPLDLEAMLSVYERATILTRFPWPVGLMREALTGADV